MPNPVEIDFGHIVSADYPLPVSAGAVVSTVNSTATALSGAASFTGTGELNSHPDVMVTCKTDVMGTLYIEFSIDGGSNYDTSIPYVVSAGIGEFHVVVKGNRTCRVRYVNGSSAQSYFRLQTQFGTFRQPNKGLQSAAYRDDDAAIVRPVEWYQSVQEGRWPNYSMITKFGANNSIDTSGEDLWHGGGTYTGQPVGATPELVTVVSDNTNDTSAGTGARTIRITGLRTSTSTAYTTEDITLNGTTPVDSVNSWYRINRAIVLTAGSGGENAGIITIAHKVTTANVFAKMPAGFNQTQIAAWTVPYGSTAWIKRVRISAIRANSAAGTAQISIRVRNPGGVYRAVRFFEVSTAAPVQYTALGGAELTSMSDIKVRCDSCSNAGTLAEAALEMLIVED